jgi:HPt (histidine-containing phosphotransfer) domain-containing protein
MTSETPQPAPAPDLRPLLEDIGDDSIVAEVVLAYLQQLPERCAALLDASHAGHHERVANVAHALVPATILVGYPALEAPLREVERAPDAAARVRWLVEQLQAIAGPLERAAAELLGAD